MLDIGGSHKYWRESQILGVQMRKQNSWNFWSQWMNSVISLVQETSGRFRASSMGGSTTEWDSTMLAMHVTGMLLACCMVQHNWLFHSLPAIVVYLISSLSVAWVRIFCFFGFLLYLFRTGNLKSTQSGFLTSSALCHRFPNSAFHSQGCLQWHLASTHPAYSKQFPALKFYRNYI